MHYTYILECADGSLYTGYTTDLSRRVKEHNTGQGARYTSGRRPVSLVYHEVFSTQRKAMRRELEIKKLHRSEKLSLIEEGELNCHG